MRIFKHLLVLLLFCFIWTSCDQSKIPGINEWATFSPAGARFSILMPITPTYSTVTKDTPAGQLPVYFYTATPSKGYEFGVTHNSFPASADLTRIFDLTEYATVKSGAQMISRKDINLNGIPGRELVYEAEGQVVSLRLYLIDREIYQAICVMPKGSIKQKLVNGFLDSFQLK